MTCAFSRECCEVDATAITAVCGGLLHLRKYDFLDIVKTIILFRLKKNIINFYFWYTPIGLRAYANNKCAI
jgi:hypothetical protein